MSGSELLLSDLGRSLVGLEGVVTDLLALVAGGVLADVAVVVTLHLVVEDLGLAGAGVGDEVGVDEVEDVTADLVELALDGGDVLLDLLDLGVVAAALLLLLDGGDDSPGGTTGADDVLVGDAEKVALLNAELDVHLGDLLHVLDHLVVTLGLLGELGHVDAVFTLLSGHFCWLLFASLLGVWALKKIKN